VKAGGGNKKFKDLPSMKESRAAPEEPPPKTETSEEKKKRERMENL